MLGCIHVSWGKEVVNYGIQPSTQPIIIAKGLGLLKPIEKKFNVQIKLRSFSYGAPENEAMASGAIQIASAGMGPAVVAAARLPAKLLAITILDQTALLVPKNSKITSVTQLKGKAVAYPGIGSQQYPLLVKALHDAGMTIHSIRLFKTKGSEIGPLIKQGSVAAGITWDPHVSYALADGYARILLTASQIMPIMQGHYVGNGEYARTAFIKKHKKLVQALIDANVEAIKFILHHPNKAARIWSKLVGIPERVALYSVKHHISVFSLDVTPTKKTVMDYVKFLKEGGILRPSDNPKIDGTFAMRALKRVRSGT